MKSKSSSAKAFQKLPSETAAEEPLPGQFQVTILLMGGQQYSVTLSADSPLLKELYEVLLSTHSQKGRLFQLPIQQGRAMLTFQSDRLVGLITEPPLIIEQAPQVPATSGADQESCDLDPLKSSYVQIENFLTAAEHQELLTYVVGQQAEFVPTTTFTGTNNYRESVVLYAFPKFEALMQQQIQAVLPHVLQQLKLSPFQVDQIESQMTAHNDGNFYKVHNDNGSPDTANRILTYVYYFYREPRPFTGGELLIYDSKIENNYYTQADTFTVVQPQNNSIVFFLSRYMHEVLPIQCPSGNFADSRFTLNGWIRRA